MNPEMARHYLFINNAYITKYMGKELNNIAKIIKNIFTRKNKMSA